MKENIIGFHIPMHNVVLVQYLKGILQLLEDQQRILLRQLDLFRQQVLKRATIAILINEVKVIGGLEHVIILDNVGVALDVGEDVYLIDCAFLKLLVLFEFIDRDHLYRVLLLVVVVYGAVHLPVDAGTDRFVQHVVLDVFYHRCGSLILL